MSEDAQRTPAWPGKAQSMALADAPGEGRAEKLITLAAPPAHPANEFTADALAN